LLVSLLENNEEDADLIKNRGEKFSRGFLHSEFFGGGVSRYATTPLIVALSPGHNQVSSVVTNRDSKSFVSRGPKKFQKLLTGIGYCLV
jgi:hypothetical protein